MPRFYARILLVLLVAAAPAAAAPPPIVTQPDPPARVGRLVPLAGAVSFHTADQTQWSQAVANTPVTTGDAIWTEPASRAAVDVAGNRLVLDGGTELAVTTLDDHALTAEQRQGSLYLHLRAAPQGDTYSVLTPRGQVDIAAAGRYLVAAGDAEHPALVSVVEGAARVTAPGVTLDIGPGQTATLTGGGAQPVAGALGPLQRDAFLQAMLAADRPAPRPAIARMTGAADLEDNGTWRQAPGVGEVWYPAVEPGWVPYRHGRWAWVEPWGWTWVDDAPWGFAPFHYGRWLEQDGRWCWTPRVAGPVVAVYQELPVYAPALVSFVYLQAPSPRLRPVGWVPLGINEPYFPPYRAQLPYVRRLNAPVVQNVNVVVNDNSRHVSVYNPVLVQNFVNRRAVTVVPAPAMQESHPIAAAVLPGPRQFDRATARFSAPLAPTTATLGVTAAVAQRLRLPADRTALAAPAPGPAITGQPRAVLAPRLPAHAIPQAQPMPAAPMSPSLAERREPFRPALPAALPAPALPGPHGGPERRPAALAPPHPGPGLAGTPHPGLPPASPAVLAPALPPALPHVVRPDALGHAGLPQPRPPAAHAEPMRPAEPPHGAPPVVFRPPPPHPAAEFRPPRPAAEFHAPPHHAAPPPPHQAPPHPPSRPEENRRS